MTLDPKYVLAKWLCGAIGGDPTGDVRQADAQSMLDDLAKAGWTVVRAPHEDKALGTLNAWGYPIRDTV